MARDGNKDGGPWTAEAANTMQTFVFQMRPSLKSWRIPQILLTRYFSKDYSKYFDPCQEAAERTYRCLTRNDGDRDFCKDYFEYVHDPSFNRDTDQRRRQEHIKNARRSG
jgi:hypothetical protein